MKKKLIALFLLVVMMATMLASCNTNPADTMEGAGLGGPSEPGEEVPDLLPEGSWYDGYEFTFLISGNFSNNDFKYEEGDESVVNQAKYKIISGIAEKYGVAIVTDNVIKFGSSTGSGTGFNKMATQYQSTSTEYDAAMIGTYDVSTAAYNGYLTDMNSDILPHLDLYKSWWDQRANDSLMIDSKMFYTTGDISLTDNIITNCIMFNKDIIAEKEDMLNPYELVRSNKWTWDNFITEVRKVTEDLDGNDKMDFNDRYGLLTWNDAFLASFSSARESFAIINDNNEAELSVYTQRSAAMVAKYIELIKSTDTVYNYQTNLKSSEWDPTRIAMFDNNQAAYYMTTFNTVPKHRNSDTDFGILPFPKLAEDQENYGHLVSAYHCQFVCVPYHIEDPELVGGILEELAYEGKRQMTPAYYDQTLIGKVVRDDESVEMLDIIFASAMYDIGIYYKIGGLIDTVMSMASSKQDQFSSYYNALRPAALADIKNINSMFKEVLGEE